MKIKNVNELTHTKPSEDYPYSASAEVFHTDQLFFYSEEVEPGKKSSAPHYHKKIDEIILVLEGELEAFEEEESKTLKAGDTILFGANSKKLHYLENQSQQTAKFLIFRTSTSVNDTQF